MEIQKKEANLFRFPVVLCDTEGMQREEWLSWRKRGIGGSDAAAVSGVSRYKSKVALFHEKIAPATDEETTERQAKKFRAGHALEPVIARMFAEDTGKTVVHLPYMYQHPECAHMLANVDFGIEGENAGLECKNSAYRADWQDGNVPDEYFIQCQHYMAVTGADRWYLAYLLDGWDFQYVTIERSQTIIDMMIEQQRDFWHNHIIPKIAPEFDGSASSNEVIKILFPAEEKGSVIELGNDVDDLLQLQDQASEEEKAAKERKDAIANQIKAIIGNHEFALTPFHKLTFKTVEAKPYTVEGKSYRRIYKSKRQA